MQDKKVILAVCTLFATLWASPFTAFAGGKKDSQNGATKVPNGNADEVIGTKPYYGEGGGRGGGTPPEDSGARVESVLGQVSVSGTKKKPIASLRIDGTKTLQLDFSTMDSEPKAKTIFALDGKTLNVSGWQQDGIFYVLDYSEL